MNPKQSMKRKLVNAKWDRDVAESRAKKLEAQIAKQSEILRILKDYADTSVEKTEFIDGKEHEYTAIVIELPNDGGTDYKAISDWLEGK